ncbi:MAG: SufE family protein [Actinomycetota bacterium]|nr:SufE family protein [Actinomycetota bacterium]
MAVPQKLQSIVDLFAGAPKELRLQALLEYAGRLPPLPAHLAENPHLLERVHECQSPFFVASQVEEDGSVTFFFEAPPEAPTTRGYAGILANGLNGSTVEEVLELPNDFYLGMGLGEVISPLRLRGMSAILGRMKHQLQTANRPSPT